jgi:hypothetical protein
MVPCYLQGIAGRVGWHPAHMGRVHVCGVAGRQLQPEAAFRGPGTHCCQWGTPAAAQSIAPASLLHTLQASICAHAGGCPGHRGCALLLPLAPWQAGELGTLPHTLAACGPCTLSHPSGSRYSRGPKALTGRTVTGGQVRLPTAPLPTEMQRGTCRLPHQMRT